MSTNSTMPLSLFILMENGEYLELEHFKKKEQSELKG